MTQYADEVANADALVRCAAGDHSFVQVVSVKFGLKPVTLDGRQERHRAEKYGAGWLVWACSICGDPGYDIGEAS